MWCVLVVYVFGLRMFVTLDFMVFVMFVVVF